MNELRALQQEIVACERCPRLRAHARAMAQIKRRAYQDHEYWGKPVPSFGDPKASVLYQRVTNANAASDQLARLIEAWIEKAA